MPDEVFIFVVAALPPSARSSFTHEPSWAISPPTEFDLGAPNMSEKTILTIAYSAVGALGLWLIIDVAGWIATIAGAGLMFFAGTGLAGMATFGSADRAENFGKSGKAHPSFQLSSIIFANKFNNFFIDLNYLEVNEVYVAGQQIAPMIKYRTSYNMPRVLPPEIEFPYCTVGEFNMLFSILEGREDLENLNLLQDAVSEFQKQFKGEIENLSLYLSR